MKGFSLPLEWPDDPTLRAEIEVDIQQFLEWRLNATPQYEELLSSVLFEHDGAPFTTTELAALLSGGSSKEFESEITTGRIAERRPLFHRFALP